MYIGRGTSPNRFFGGDIAGLFIVDEFLTEEAVTEVYSQMLNGVDLTDITCPTGNTCTACPVGTYKDSTGSVMCTACTAGLSSPFASTSNAVCIVIDYTTSFSRPAFRTYTCSTNRKLSSCATRTSCTRHYTRSFSRIALRTCNCSTKGILSSYATGTIYVSGCIRKLSRTAIINMCRRNLQNNHRKCRTRPR
jgi:hypothetical protein